MKKTILLIISIFSLFAAVPTGWAIYAGLTNTPVFPMNPYAAAVGALAVITTSASAGLLLTDIKSHNQALRDDEQNEFNMTSKHAWFIIAGCALAEITLSLLIVVIPTALSFGVLVFPLLSLAGVFSLSVRYDLTKRENSLALLRAKIEQAAENAKADHKKDLEEKRKARQSAKSASKSVAHAMQSIGSPAQSVAGATQYPRRCTHCATDISDEIALIKNSFAVGGHMKKHHPELCKPKTLAGNFFDNALQAKK